MGSFLESLSGIHIYITVGLLIAVVILLFMVIVLFKSLSALENRYKKFMRGANNKNIEELIMSYLDRVDSAKEQAEYVREICKELDNRIKGCIQKVSVVRYRAFEDVGSDLSYSIALLDHNNDGVVLTSIYGRNESTTYAKPIDKGISRYDLSSEEDTVLKEAMNKKLT